MIKIRYNAGDIFKTLTKSTGYGIVAYQVIKRFKRGKKLNSLIHYRLVEILGKRDDIGSNEWWGSGRDLEFDLTCYQLEKMKEIGKITLLEPNEAALLLLKNNDENKQSQK